MTDPANDRPGAVADLLSLLEVEQIDTDLFRGMSPAGEAGRVFGGQVVAQALAAAARDLDDGSVDARPAHSLHAYFLRAGDPARPIIYRVLRDFDGTSFANRRVVAMQGSKPILNLAASFHRKEGGFEHAAPMRAVTPPEDCLTLADALAAAGQSFPSATMDRLAPFEIRRGLPPEHREGMPRQFFWFRLRSSLPISPNLGRVILAYASDFALFSTAALPHSEVFFTPRLQVASLDHALWLHAEPDVNDWLLYDMDSPWAGRARGFARGSFYDRNGLLVASVAQEGLCRQRD